MGWRTGRVTLRLTHSCAGTTTGRRSVTMKSSWPSNFLSATGLKQERAAAHDFEVALPKRK